jgi:C-terminal processing protease CtpA/Prc
VWADGQGPAPRAVADKLGAANGLQVISVVAGRPAAVAGVCRGDIVLGVDGRHVVTATGALVDVFVIPCELAD